VKTTIAVGAALIVGIAIGYLIDQATIRHLRRRLRELRGGKPRFTIQSVTRFIFLTAQVCAIIWVSWSYVISTYATVVLGQVFPAEELSKEAVKTILGVGALKVIGNIFEHNEGPVFGWTPGTKDPPGEVPASEEPQEEIPTEETEGKG